MFLEEGKNYHGLIIHKYCGGGAYGEVYYGEDISGKKMAVKIISKKRLGNHWERELKGVINYRKITENNGNLLQIYHVEDDNEFFYYTMDAADSIGANEYIPDTLAQRLQKGALHQSELFFILMDIFQGIKVLHNAGFSHRDIKPDNILFVNEKPKLADIGLLSANSTTFTQLAGTLDFIPPEERSADTLDSSNNKSRQCNDLYAFGKVIYCCITGCSVNEFPSIPKDFTFTLPLKFFVRLALQLCNKERAKRLNNIAQLEHELKEIERKLLCGETFVDKLKYIIKTFFKDFKAHLSSFVKFSFKYIWLLLLLIATITATLYYYFKPSPPFDITKQKSKVFQNDNMKISMKIPSRWEIFSQDTINYIMNKEYEDKDHNKLFTSKQIEAMLTAIKQGQSFIYCDFDPIFSDNINISTLPKKNIPANISIEEFKLIIKSLYEGELNFEVIIYNAEYKTIANQKCLAIDFTFMPNLCRTQLYWIMTQDNILNITLTAKFATFEKRKEELESVLSTLKVEK